MHTDTANFDFKLNDRNALAQLSRLNSSPLARRTATNTKEVKIVGFFQDELLNR